ncbi:MAG: glycosidase, partial [Phycisphaeraceae bacterium]
LRRPSGFVSTQARHEQAPDICLSWSDDLKTWSDPEPLISPAFDWENNRIGGSSPPIRTEAGWLVFYHGVETLDASVRRVCYRMGAAMLDGSDPTRVIARCDHPLFEPEAYYEKVGAYIPNVVFPTAALPVDGEIYLYYGCCDTAIGLATANLADVVDHVMQYPLRP